jgi:hypothetical protein
MERQAVDSSNIRSIGYDPETWTLEVEFTTGAVYQYECEPELAQAFLDAESKGKFFAQHIRPLRGTRVDV